MAAGVGSRYGGLKQLDAIGSCGETILEYSLYDAYKAGFNHVVFVIRKETEDLFKTKVLPRLPKALTVQFAHQELHSCMPEGLSVPVDRTKPWGTGHALLVAKDKVQGSFAVINADDYYGPQAFQLLATFLKANHTDYAMVGYPLKNTLSKNGYVSRGLCQISEESNLLSVKELTHIESIATGAILYTDENKKKHPLTGNELVSMNCWGFQSKVFQALQEGFTHFLKTAEHPEKDEFYLPFLVDQLIQKGQASVSVLKSTDPWYGVTYPEDKHWVCSEIKKLSQSNLYPQPLWP